MSTTADTNIAQYSTSVSDGVLAAVTAVAVWNTFLSNYFYASFGFLLVVAAACFGVVRFSQCRPSETLINWHRYMSWLAQCVGMTLIAASFTQHTSLSVATFFSLSSFAVVLLRDRVIPSHLCAQAGDLLGSVSVVSIFVFGCAKFNGFAIVGSSLMVVAGVVVKTEGQIGRFLRVDLFHYLLAIANIALMKGLMIHNLPAVYYTP